LPVVFGSRYTLPNLSNHLCNRALLNNATESKVEDFFDAATKAVVVGGKTFTDKNNYDSTKHYGKKIFAHQVIRPNAATINFSGFIPLLTNIALVVKDHAAAVGNTAPQAQVVAQP
jgi:hypothetical protein